jgi:myo-inositol-1(or 4)-monophosphatase
VSAEASSAELVEVAVDAAQAAATLLLARFQAGPERRMESKSTPTDLVSDADLAAQEAVRAVIAERRPHDGFLAEEQGADERGTSGRDWIVDPLDGTINFLFGIPQWCVSVAVRDEHGTLAGAIVDAYAQETFTATRDGAAYLGGVAIPSRADAGRPLSDALVATGFAYDARVREQQGATVARLLGRVRDIRRFGSAALDLAWTALGRYDAYYERTVKPWDIAAGVLICGCAGLELRTLSDGILVAPPSLVDELEMLVGGDPALA